MNYLTQKIWQNINKNNIEKKYLKKLDKQGFCVFEKKKKILEWLGCDIKYLRKKIDELIKKEKDKAGYEGREEYYKKGRYFEPSAKRLGNLPNKDIVFKKFVMFPDLISCASHIIKSEIMFSSSNFREPKKNSGDQRLHIDWLPRNKSTDKFQSVIAMMYLDDSNKKN